MVADTHGRWHLTGDVEVYAARAGDLLAAYPADNTVALTVVDGVRAGRYAGAEMLFGWLDPGDGGAVTGAVSLTPPFGLLLAVLPPNSVAGLVGVLRANGTQLPDVFGELEAAEAFAAAWTAGTPLTAVTSVRQRLYTLGTLAPPDPGPPGRARRAEATDQETAVTWWEAAQAEMGSHQVRADALVASRIEAGLIWLWEGPDGVSVSLAGRNAAAAGVSRVGPVYTPPEHRRRGYGAAVTAAVTAAALREDAEQAVLFTDLANPTSNAIYQQIGYRPVSDRVLVRFDAP